MGRRQWAYTSVGFARQGDLNTENTTNGDFHYMLVDADIPETARQIYDIAAKTGQVGASQAPAVGVKRPNLKMRLPLFGFKRQFSPGSEEAGVTDGVVSAAQVLLGLLLGSSSDAPATAEELRRGVGLAIADYSAAFGATVATGDVVAVPSALTLTVQAGNGAKYIPGQLFVAGSSATDAAQSVAWIRSIAGDTLTFIDAPGNAPQGNDDTFPSVVAYQSSQQPQPLTIRVLGDNAAFKTSFVGCVPNKGKIEAKAGEPPMLEIEFVCAGAVEYSSGGGLQQPTVTPQLPMPIVGTGAGRLTWAAAGSAMAALHGVRELSIEIANELAMVPSHNTASGISEILVADRKITITMQIPRGSADTVSNGNRPWDTAIEAGTAYQLAVYGGRLPGTLFSILAPSLHLAAAPKMVDADGLIYDELEFRPGVYTDDSGSGDAADTNFRVGWA